MKLSDIKFVKDYIYMANEGYLRRWHERNGGNFSYRIAPEEVAEILPFLHEPRATTSIDVDIPELKNEYFLVTGTGRFMGNVIRDPEYNIGIVKIDETGKNYSILWGFRDGGKPTSELPTHLLNHNIKKKQTNGQYRVIYHAHPTNTIALSFALPLEDKTFSHILWEMMTECPIVFPQGVGVVPWMVPGGREIALETGKLMPQYDVIIWAHHGVFCAGENFDTTFGLMDTVEKAAEICIKVLSIGGIKQTISDQNFRDLAEAFNTNLNEEFLK